MNEATILDVAKAAGVSKSTVSRTLNKSGYVKEETRKKITAAAKALDYEPNMQAVNLSKNRSDIIGFLVPDICNSFFSEVFYGACKVAEANGKHILLINTDDNLDIEHDSLKTLLSMQICGLLMTPISDKDTRNLGILKKVRKKKIPIVFIDREVDNFACDGVFVDNERATYQATLLLIENGHTDIAIIAGPQDTVPGHERLKGFINAFKSKGLSVKNDRILYGNFKDQDSYRLVKGLLQSKKRPTAILSCNNLMTLGAVRAIMDTGLKIPDDIAIISFDDVKLLDSLGLKITSIERATYEMGKVAMNILLQRISDDESLDEFTSRSVVLQSKLIKRGSETLGNI